MKNNSEESNGEQRRYSARQRKKLDRFIAATLRAAVNKDEPSFREEIASSEWGEWLKAINEEFKSLERLKTFDIAPSPANDNVYHCKWVLRKERNQKGEIDSYEARLVVLGTKIKIDTLKSFFQSLISMSSACY